jgi:hypothetical protein
MRSPVSRRALGECKAISTGRSGHDELTFVSALETESALPRSPFERSLSGRRFRVLGVGSVTVSG